MGLSSSDHAKVQRVYSEVMMSTDSAPKASYVSNVSKISGSNCGTSSIDSAVLKRTPSLQKRVIRQQSITLQESVGSNTVEIKTQQRQRGKVLGQALRKSIEARQLRKPVNLSLVQKLPQAAAVHNDDEDDEDWAAFIAKGYGNFHRPPLHISPTSTVTSGSTFLSPSTCATSLPSADLPKSEEAWPDDDSAWASSDDDDDGEERGVPLQDKSDEEQEIVKSPMIPIPQDSIKKQPGPSSDLSYTLRGSPQRRPVLAPKVQERGTVIRTRLAEGSCHGSKSKMPSIEVSDEYASALSPREVLRARSSSKVLRILGDEAGQPRPRQAVQGSYHHCTQDGDSTVSSLAYLSPSTTKSQSTASRFRHRLTSRMNLPGSRRTSTPDVPVTPCSASSDIAQAREDRNSLSPSCAIFGSAAINARASAYAAMAASMLSSDQDSLRSSACSRISEEVSHDTPIEEGYSAVPKAGFCFDYDPRSPLYLSSLEEGS